MKYQCLACKAADNCELSWKDPTEEYMNCTEFKAPPRTNADRIRSMTDEELAKWLNNMQGYSFGCGLLESRISEYPNCYNAWLKWLKDGET